MVTLGNRRHFGLSGLLGQYLFAAIGHYRCRDTFRRLQPTKGGVFLPDQPAVLPGRSGVSGALANGELLKFTKTRWIFHLGVANDAGFHRASPLQHWHACLHILFVSTS